MIRDVTGRCRDCWLLAVLPEVPDAPDVVEDCSDKGFLGLGEPQIRKGSTLARFGAHFHVDSHTELRLRSVDLGERLRDLLGILANRVIEPH